jgi:hypothetical protein
VQIACHHRRMNTLRQECGRTYAGGEAVWEKFSRIERRELTLYQLEIGVDYGEGEERTIDAVQETPVSG